MAWLLIVWVQLRGQWAALQLVGKHPEGLGRHFEHVSESLVNLETTNALYDDIPSPCLYSTLISPKRTLLDGSLSTLK